MQNELNFENENVTKKKINNISNALIKKQNKLGSNDNIELKHGVEAANTAKEIVNNSQEFSNAEYNLNLAKTINQLENLKIDADFNKQQINNNIKNYAANVALKENALNQTKNFFDLENSKMSPKQLFGFASNAMKAKSFEDMGNNALSMHESIYNDAKNANLLGQQADILNDKRNMLNLNIMQQNQGREADVLEYLIKKSRNEQQNNKIDSAIDDFDKLKNDTIDNIADNINRDYIANNVSGNFFNNNSFSTDYTKIGALHNVLGSMERAAEDFGATNTAALGEIIGIGRENPVSNFFQNASNKTAKDLQRLNYSGQLFTNSALGDLYDKDAGFFNNLGRMAPAGGNAFLGKGAESAGEMAMIGGSMFAPEVFLPAYWAYKTAEIGRERQANEEGVDALESQSIISAENARDAMLWSALDTAVARISPEMFFGAIGKGINNKLLKGSALKNATTNLRNNTIGKIADKIAPTPRTILGGTANMGKMITAGALGEGSQEFLQSAIEYRAANPNATLDEIINAGKEGFKEALLPGAGFGGIAGGLRTGKYARDIYDYHKINRDVRKSHIDNAKKQAEIGLEAINKGFEKNAETGEYVSKDLDEQTKIANHFMDLNIKADDIADDHIRTIKQDIDKKFKLVEEHNLSSILNDVVDDNGNITKKSVVTNLMESLGLDTTNEKARDAIKKGFIDRSDIVINEKTLEKLGIDKDSALGKELLAEEVAKTFLNTLYKKDKEKFKRTLKIFNKSNNLTNNEYDKKNYSEMTRAERIAFANMYQNITNKEAELERRKQAKEAMREAKKVPESTSKVDTKTENNEEEVVENNQNNLNDSGIYEQQSYTMNKDGTVEDITYSGESAIGAAKADLSSIDDIFNGINIIEEGSKGIEIEDMNTINSQTLPLYQKALKAYSFLKNNKEVDSEGSTYTTNMQRKIAGQINALLTKTEPLTKEEIKFLEDCVESGIFQELYEADAANNINKQKDDAKVKESRSKNKKSSKKESETTRGSNANRVDANKDISYSEAGLQARLGLPPELAAKLAISISEGHAKAALKKMNSSKTIHGVESDLLTKIDVVGQDISKILAGIKSRTIGSTKKGIANILSRISTLQSYRKDRILLKNSLQKISENINGYSQFVVSDGGSKRVYFKYNSDEKSSNPSINLLTEEEVKNELGINENNSFANPQDINNFNKMRKKHINYVDIVNVDNNQSTNALIKELDTEIKALDDMIDLYKKKVKTNIGKDTKDFQDKYNTNVKTENVKKRIDKNINGNIEVDKQGNLSETSIEKISSGFKNILNLRDSTKKRIDNLKKALNAEKDDATKITRLNDIINELESRLNELDNVINDILNDDTIIYSNDLAINNEIKQLLKDTVTLIQQQNDLSESISITRQIFNAMKELQLLVKGDITLRHILNNTIRQYLLMKRSLSKQLKLFVQKRNEFIKKYGENKANKILATHNIQSIDLNKINMKTKRLDVLADKFLDTHTESITSYFWSNQKGIGVKDYKDLQELFGEDFIKDEIVSVRNIEEFRNIFDIFSMNPENMELFNDDGKYFKENEFFKFKYTDFSNLIKNILFTNVLSDNTFNDLYVEQADGKTFKLKEAINKALYFGFLKTINDVVSPSTRLEEKGSDNKHLSNSVKDKVGVSKTEFNKMLARNTLDILGANVKGEFTLGEQATFVETFGTILGQVIEEGFRDKQVNKGFFGINLNNESSLEITSLSTENALYLRKYIEELEKKNIFDNNIAAKSESDVLRKARHTIKRSFFGVSISPLERQAIIMEALQKRQLSESTSKILNEIDMSIENGEVDKLAELLLDGISAQHINTVKEKKIILNTDRIQSVLGEIKYYVLKKNTTWNDQDADNYIKKLKKEMKIEDDASNNKEYFKTENARLIAIQNSNDIALEISNNLEILQFNQDFKDGAYFVPDILINKRQQLQGSKFNTLSNKPLRKLIKYFDYNEDNIEKLNQEAQKKYIKNGDEATELLLDHIAYMSEVVDLAKVTKDKLEDARKAPQAVYNEIISSIKNKNLKTDFERAIEVRKNLEKNGINLKKMTNMELATLIGSFDIKDNGSVTVTTSNFPAAEVDISSSGTTITSFVSGTNYAQQALMASGGFVLGQNFDIRQGDNYRDFGQNIAKHIFLTTGEEEGTVQDFFNEKDAKGKVDLSQKTLKDFKDKLSKKIDEKYSQSKDREEARFAKIVLDKLFEDANMEQNLKDFANENMGKFLVENLKQETIRNLGKPSLMVKNYAASIETAVANFIEYSVEDRFYEIQNIFNDDINSSLLKMFDSVLDPKENIRFEDFETKYKMIKAQPNDYEIKKYKEIFGEENNDEIFKYYIEQHYEALRDIKYLFGINSLNEFTNTLFDEKTIDGKKRTKFDDILDKFSKISDTTIKNVFNSMNSGANEVNQAILTSYRLMTATVFNKVVNRYNNTHQDKISMVIEKDGTVVLDITDARKDKLKEIYKEVLKEEKFFSEYKYTNSPNAEANINLAVDFIFDMVKQDGSRQVSNPDNIEKAGTSTINNDRNYSKVTGQRVYLRDIGLAIITNIGQSPDGESMTMLKAVSSHPFSNNYDAITSNPYVLAELAKDANYLFFTMMLDKNNHLTQRLLSYVERFREFYGITDIDNIINASKLGGSKESVISSISTLLFLNEANMSDAMNKLEEVNIFHGSPSEDTSHILTETEKKQVKRVFKRKIINNVKKIRSNMPKFIMSILNLGGKISLYNNTDIKNEFKRIEDLYKFIYDIINNKDNDNTLSNDFRNKVIELFGIDKDSINPEKLITFKELNEKGDNVEAITLLNQILSDNNIVSFIEKINELFDERNVIYSQSEIDTGNTPMEGKTSISEIKNNLFNMIFKDNKISNNTNLKDMEVLDNLANFILNDMQEKIRNGEPINNLYFRLRSSLTESEMKADDVIDFDLNDTYITKDWTEPEPNDNNADFKFYKDNILPMSSSILPKNTKAQSFFKNLLGRAFLEKDVDLSLTDLIAISVLKDKGLLNTYLDSTTPDGQTIYAGNLRSNIEKSYANFIDSDANKTYSSKTAKGMLEDISTYRSNTFYSHNYHPNGFSDGQFNNAKANSLLNKETKKSNKVDGASEKEVNANEANPKENNNISGSAQFSRNRNVSDTKEGSRNSANMGKTEEEMLDDIEYSLDYIDEEIKNIGDIKKEKAIFEKLGEEDAKNYQNLTGKTISEEENLFYNEMHDTFFSCSYGRQFLQDEFRIVVKRNTKDGYQEGFYQPILRMATVLIGGRNANNMSAREIYLHELSHAIWDYVFDHRNDKKFSALVNELMDLKIKAMRYFEANQLELAEKIGVDVETFKTQYLDYMRKNDVEFMAIVSSNFVLNSALKNINTDVKQKIVDKGKASWVDRLKTIIKKTIDLVFDTGLNASSQTEADRFAYLQMQLAKARAGYLNDYRNSRVTGIMNTALNWADNKLQPLTEKISKSWEDRLEAQMDEMIQMARNGEGDKINKEKAYAYATKAILSTSGAKSRLSLKTGVLLTEVLGAKYGGIIEQLWSRGSALDVGKRIMEFNKAQNDRIDKDRNALENSLIIDMKRSFNRELSDEEQKALTSVLRKTDLSSLILEPNSNFDEIFDYVKDDIKRAQRVEALYKDLDGLVDGNKILLGFYKKQIKTLAKYMVTGELDGYLLNNANNIALALMTNKHPKNMPTTKELMENKNIKVIRDIIDEITTLQSISYLNENDINTFRQLLNTDRAGVDNLVNFTYNVTSKSKAMFNKIDEKGEHRILPSNYAKGYISVKNNNSVVVKVDKIDSQTRSDMKKLGYELIKAYPNLGGADYGIYMSKEDVNLKFNRGILRTSSNSVSGLSRASVIKAFNKDKSEEEIATMIKAENANFASKLNALDDAHWSKFNIIPQFDAKGNIIDFRYHIPNEIKAQIGVDNASIFETLARESVRQIDNLSSIEFSKKVIRNLNDYYKVNKDNKNLHFVRIDAGMILDNKLSKQARNDIEEFWNLLPYETKQYILTEEGGGVYVRTDMLHTIIGYRDFRIANTEKVESLSKETQRLIKFVENLTIKAANLNRTNIVIRNPEVMRDNILSNSYILTLYGIEPRQIIKDAADAVKLYKNYSKAMADKKLLQWKLLNENLNNARREKIEAEIADLDKIINNNIMSKFDKHGLISQIEDLEIDKDNLGDDYIDKMYNEYKSRLEQKIKKVWDELIMSENMDSFKLMSFIVQMSDLTARYSLYNKLSDDGVNETEIMDTLQRSFINYSTLDDPIVKYVNDSGLFMFTKYLFRSQSMIQGDLLNKKLGSVLMTKGLAAAINMSLVTPFGSWLPNALSKIQHRVSMYGIGPMMAVSDDIFHLDNFSPINL